LPTVSDSDLQLDAQLRDVPISDGFAERLQAALLPSDEQLDRALAGVTMPSTVLARLKEIPGDVAVDEALADFASPPALIYSLRKPTWGQRLARVGRRLRQMAVAALWFIALSAGLAAGLRAIVSGTLSPVGRQEIIIAFDGPLTVAAEQDDSTAFDVRLTTALAPNVLAPIDEAATDSSPPIARIGQPDVDGPPAAGPVAQWVTLVSTGLRPMDDAVLLRYGVLASPEYADDLLPDLVASRLPRAAGIEPPPVRGYDRAFFLKERVFPPIVPAAHPRLAELLVPLVVGSDAVMQLEQSLADGRLPEPNEVRIEDWIAAMDYRLAAGPSEALALRTAAGPALFGPPESGLLFIGVQAGGFARRPQPATHLVLALDLSHSMSRGGRLAIVRRGIGQFLEQLGPRDRLSLVVFNEEVVQVVEAATRDDAASIRQLLGDLSPRGGTDLAAGLQHAVSLAMTDPCGPDAARRMVLITDSQVSMPGETRQGLEQVLAAAGAMGVRLDVLDLSQRSQIDSTLHAWADELGGELRPIDSARQMYRLLLESLAGREATIARDARLKLHFNPQTVAAYRLVGHEANSLADLTPAAVEAELAAGEFAAALLEIWFLPGDGNDLGYAELTWHDPDGGREQRVRQPLSRLQFAPSLKEAPLPVVQASLAAEVGQALRGTHTTLRQAGLRPAGARGLASVAAAAKDANPQLRERPDVVQLLELVRQLQEQGVR
jgi:Ca-activated chloride channel family protein